MHQQAMMHCDIKEPNLMLKTQDLHSPKVVLVDFGVSTAMGAHDTGICGGTPGYIPPETLRARKWFPKGDIFSLGVVVFQMLTDSTPNTATCTGPQPRGLFLEGCSTFREVCEATFKRTPQYEKITHNFMRLGRLTEQLLRKDQQLRPRAPEALQGPWFDHHRDSLPLASDHPLATKGITKEMLSEWMVGSTLSFRSEEKPHVNGVCVFPSTDTSAVVAAALESMQPVRVAPPLRPWRFSTSPRPNEAPSPSRRGSYSCRKLVQGAGEAQRQVVPPHDRRAFSMEVAPAPVYTPQRTSAAPSVATPLAAVGPVARVVMSPQHTQRSSSTEAQPTRALLVESPLLTRTGSRTRVQTSLSPHARCRRSRSLQVPPSGATPGAKNVFGSRTPVPPTGTPTVVSPLATPIVYKRAASATIPIPQSGAATRVRSPQPRRDASPQVSVLPRGNGASVILTSPGAYCRSATPPVSSTLSPAMPASRLVTRFFSSPRSQDLKSPRLSVPVTFAWQGPCAPTVSAPRLARRPDATPRLD